MVSLRSTDSNLEERFKTLAHDHSGSELSWTVPFSLNTTSEYWIAVKEVGTDTEYLSPRFQVAYGVSVVYFGSAEGNRFHIEAKDAPVLTLLVFCSLAFVLWLSRGYSLAITDLSTYNERWKRSLAIFLIELVNSAYLIIFWGQQNTSSSKDGTILFFVVALLQGLEILLVFITWDIDPSDLKVLNICTT